jgi:hypothetical protein
MQATVFSSYRFEYTLPDEQSAVAFNLFVQWLYTKTYNERTGQAAAFDAALRYTDLILAISTQPEDTMDWSIKAAVIAWQVGSHLLSAEFQDYAMQRLFAAYSRHHTPLTAQIFEFIVKDRIGTQLSTNLEALGTSSRTWLCETGATSSLSITQTRPNGRVCSKASVLSAGSSWRLMCSFSRSAVRQ